MIARHAYDDSLAARAATVASIATLVTLVVVAATDEGGPWAQRLGMTAALAPVAGAIGTLAAVRIAASRGELRALAAIGADPARAVLGAIAGGALVGLLGPLLVALGLADPAPLFPAPLAARRWMADGAGLRELTLGLRVAADGALSLDAPRDGARALPAAATPFTVVALAAAAIACPLWIGAARGSAARRALVGGLAIASAIVAFQGVAAESVPAAAIVVAPLVLIADTVIARLAQGAQRLPHDGRSRRWSRRSRGITP